MSMGEIVSLDDLPFARALKTKKTQDANVFSIYQPLSKMLKWLKMEATPHLSLETQEVLGVFCIFTDVSKEHILNEKVNRQLKNFKTLGNNMPDVVLRIDENANIIFANKKALEFFQIKTDEYEDNKLFDFSMFQTDESKNICKIFNDLNQVSSTVTYTLNNVIGKKNFNYFIRIILEETSSDKKIFLLIIEDITERIESEDMFNQLFSHASDAIILTNHNSGQIKSINHKALKIFDLEESNIDNFSTDDIFEIFHDKNALNIHIASLEEFGVDNFEITKTLKNNAIRYLKVFCSLIRVGKETYHQSIVHDLTEHKLLEIQLQQTSKVFEHTVDGILITDLTGKILSVNDAFTKITGYTLADVIGRKPSILKSDKQDANFYKKMWNDIIHAGLFKGEIWNKKKDGTVYPEWLAISPIYNDAHEVIQYVAVFSDFSEIKKTQNKLENLAHYDTLTKLPNRLLLHEKIAQSIKIAKRNKLKIAVLFIDLDKFKLINDTYGHGVGDEVLKVASLRLQSVVRESDIVARLGGDEFIVVLNDIKNSNNIVVVAQNILNKLQIPFTINNHEHYISCSIGISIYPNDTHKDDVDILIKNADIAMYESKSTGRNTYHCFSKNMAKNVTKLSNLHHDLHLALKNDEFYLTYQPQCDVVKDKIIGFEALIRWNHPTKGEVFPDDFIPYAEESKLIIPIGTWVIKQAIEDYYKLKQTLLTDFCISVNVAPVQINQDFISILKEMRLKHKDFAKIIKIEITESMAMGNFKNALNIIEQIKILGFKISMDDFGTGYSSLSAIRKLKINEIKIDKSFIKDVPGDKDDEELVSTIIAMAKVMKKSVVAEGVETLLTRNFLIERRCSIIQGYLIAKPMKIEDALEFVTNYNLACSPIS